VITQAAGYASGIAILLSFVPYVRDIFLGKTKPERASWLIWALLGFISFFSQFAKGALWSLTMTGAQAAGDLFIFLVAIKYGLGGLNRRDIIGLTGAAVGLILWYFSSEAAVALLIVILIDATGAVLTVIKSYEHPTTETASSWALTLFGGVFACVAVGSLNLILLAFPFYICLASAAILAAMFLGARRLS
jgi:hypothetical protein